MKRYTKEHQWIELDASGTATIGITQFAADELGELSYVELPQVGKSVNGGDALCAVESVKAASDVFMPVTGTVCEVNQALEQTPELVNDQPEAAGWICKASQVSTDAVNALMDEAAYKAFVSGK